MFNTTEFQQRRNQLLSKMGSGVAIIPTAPEVVRNRDSHYPYRFDSYFYYLTGFTEPESVLVLIAGNAAKSQSPKSILFCRDKDIEREIWDGFHFVQPIGYAFIPRRIKTQAIKQLVLISH